MDSAIRARVEAAGYMYLGQENKGRYCHGMVTLCGDLAAMHFLRDEQLLRLFFNAQVRKGNPFTYGELKSAIKPNSTDAVNHLYQQIHWLAGQQILLRGYALHCPICDLAVWYDLASVEEFTTCQGCRSPIQLSLEANFSFRLNQLFIEGLKQGAATVLLTALRLREIAQTSANIFIWQAGVRLKRRGQFAEIDLIALCDDRLIIAECKDNFEDAASLHNQLQRNAEIALDLKADEFIFASLRDIDLNTVSALDGIASLTRWLRTDLLNGDDH